MIMSASHPPAGDLKRFAGLLLALLVTRSFAATAPVESANADIIAAETDLQHGECSSATRRYVEASAQMSDVKLAAHATEVALDCGQYQQALQVTERWRALSPQADEPLYAAVRAELGRYRIEAARAQFRLWLGAKPARSDEDTVSAVANLAQQAGAAPTLDMIRDQPVSKRWRSWPSRVGISSGPYAMRRRRKPRALMPAPLRHWKRAHRPDSGTPMPRSRPRTAPLPVARSNIWRLPKRC